MSKDLLSNMLSSIKNATRVKKPEIEVFYSKECENVLKQLKASGYIEDYKVFKPKGKSFKKISIKLMYVNGESKIADLKRVSKPGRRVYKGASELTLLYGGLGLVVVSTSRGVMSAFEAKKKKLGGEVLCKVW